MRAPTTKDASEIWRLVKESGVLDENSAYLYLLICRDFADTSIVACRDEEVVGFVSGYCPPSHPSTLFVWQVGVAKTARRQGIALKMLEALAARVRQAKQHEVETISIEATVSPSNQASRKLFESLARSLNTELVDLPNDGFTADEFPTGGDHEAEPRLRIGPIPTA